jgi:hypothetical protein
MSVNTYPLAWPDGWPRVRYRKEGKFATKGSTNENGWRPTVDITMVDAMKRVKYELERLGVNVADDSIVSTNLKLNLSGLPRGDQGEPGDPGAAVYFQKKNGPMRVIAIDAYTRVRDNIAAIAATLEAMRAIERHGGAQILERAFTGFAALTAPGKNWWDVLEVKPDATRQVIEANFRRLAHDRHPDRGGDHAKMAELNEARDAALRAKA